MAAMNPYSVLTVVEDGDSRTKHSEATQSSHTCMQHSCSSCDSDSPGAQTKTSQLSLQCIVSKGWHGKKQVGLETYQYTALVQELRLGFARRPQQHLAALYVSQKKQQCRRLASKAVQLRPHLVYGVHLLRNVIRA